MRRIFLLLLILLGSLSACDGLEAEGHVSQIFVESYQVAGEPLQHVRLTRTSAVDGTYDAAARAVREAEVVVELLGEDGIVEVTFPYREEHPGVYVAGDTAATVLRARRYRLRVATREGESVTATTLVPHAIELLSAAVDTVTYRRAEPFELRVRRRAHSGRQNVYILTAEAQAPSEDNLTPLYREILEDENGHIDESDLAANQKNELFPSHEAVHEVDGDIVTVSMPWLLVAFYGPLHVSFNGLDDNLYDFVRSMRVQHEGGVGNSPGEIGSLIEYVDGGTGVFGSYAKVEAEVFVAR